MKLQVYQPYAAQRILVGSSDMIGRIPSLSEVFTDDLETLHSAVHPQKPISVREIRTVVSPILRRWVADGDLGRLGRVLTGKITVPAVQGSGLVSCASILDPVHFVATLGAVAEDYRISNSVVLGSPDSVEKHLALRLIRENSEKSVIVDMKPSAFIEAPVLYYGGRIFKRRQIVKHMANKRGGKHLQHSELDEISEAIEKAAEFHRFGSAPEAFDASFSDIDFIHVTQLSHDQQAQYDCVTLECIATAQALVRTKIDGHPFLDIGADNWAVLLSQRHEYVMSEY
ncbi:MAG: hypothetical protein AAGH82_06180 [Pseudomonadota bacterium]